MSGFKVFIIIRQDNYPDGQEPSNVGISTQVLEFETQLAAQEACTIFNQHMSGENGVERELQVAYEVIPLFEWKELS